MYGLLIGLAILVILLYGANAFTRANPKALARRLKLLGGAGLLTAAAALAVAGRWGIAVPLAFAGFSLLGRHPFGASFPSRTSKTPGARSEVRSSHLAMWLDHDTGALGGRVLAGSFAGRALETMSEHDLIALRSEFSSDPESLALIEAYLDRRLPGWREATDADPAARAAPPYERAAMTEQEAHQILGLEPGADEDAIRRAHRSLMKRLHPDQGGSAYLAARVNQARDLLLHKHRRHS
jgi:hypothetical protein